MMYGAMCSAIIEISATEIVESSVKDRATFRVLIAMIIDVINSNVLTKDTK
jgi:hypothetical protein